MNMIVKGDVLGISSIVGDVVKGNHNELHRWFFLPGLFCGVADLRTVFPSVMGKPEVVL
jgi:hypothetical protein